jgi:ATP:ADP antiporter, AAA family
VKADDRSRADVRAATLAAAIVGPLIALQVGSKAVRDALFLSVFDVRLLPRIMLASAGLSLVGALLLSRMIPVHGPRRVLSRLLAGSTVLFALEAWLLPIAFRAVAVLAYVHIAALGGLSVTCFWSVVNERFDPHAARRLVGRVAAGGALGGLLGGILAERVTVWLGPRAMLSTLALLSAAVALATPRLQDTPHSRVPPVGQPSRLESTPYLRRMAALIVVVGIVSAVSDYVLKVEASTAMSSVRDLTQFFAAFYTLVSLCAFVVQAGVAQRALERIGLGGTLAVLPASMLVTGALAGGVTRLWTAVLLKGTEATLSNSLFRSAYELLYTPVDEARKRRAKALIDVGADRLGEIAGSGLVLLLLAATAGHASATAAWIVMFAAAVVLWLSVGLHRGYVQELATSLRAGTLRLSPEQASDGTTLLTLSQTLGIPDRSALLAEIERYRESNLRDAAPLATGSIDMTGMRAADAACLRDFFELTSTHPERVARILSRPSLDRRLVPHVIGLLADDRLARQARSALKHLGERAVGQLGDVLLDPTQPFRVRRRIPALLAELPSPRAVHALLAALRDERFEVRRRCGHALRGLLQSQPDLHPGTSVLVEAAVRELDVWPARDDEATVGADQSTTGPVKHMLTLVGIATGSEAIELASRALESDDALLRGTALEYLDNVLPVPVRARLLARLGSPGKPAALRSPSELLEELSRSVANLPMVGDTVPPPPNDDELG